MVQVKKKTGRPIAVHKMANGTKIPGLMRLKDGRWRLSGPEKTTFTEPDEGRAVAHFQQLMARRSGTDLIDVSVGVVQRAEQIGPLIKEALPKRISVRIPKDPAKGITVQRSFDTAEAWAYFTEQLLTRPKWVAQRTGIECLAWLPDVKKPAPSPTLKEVGEFYFSRTDVTEKELNKCKATWDEFGKAAGVTTLRDLEPQIVAAWGLKVKAEKIAPKTIYHRFNRIKTVLNHFRQTGRCIDDVRHALDCCAVLKAPETTSLDPHPMARDDFQKLLAKAEDEGKALLLVGLNLCMYPIDLARLRWPELDLSRGVYNALRGKTKVARCGVLWERTMDALKVIERSEDDEYVFHKSNGVPHTDTTIRKWFWDLREAANVAKEVQFADIRDGSFTEAVSGEGVEFQHAQVLAGHRSGIADA